jgi:trans-2-enoyl-CoA reductase
MTNPEIASEIVQKIIGNLTDRRGLRQAWDEIDEDIQTEIAETWQGIVKDVLEESL